MAIQKGINKMQGRLGDQIYYRRQGLDLVRNKALHKHQTEPSKRSAADFGTASFYGALIRKAFEPMVKFYADSKIASSLLGLLRNLIHQIPDVESGKKSLIQGNIALLAGFEFNKKTSFNSLWLQASELRFVDGELPKLILQAGNTAHIFKEFPKADKVQLQVRALNLNLANNECEVLPIKPLRISLTATHFAGKTLSIPFQLSSDRAVLIALGICYFKEGVPFQDQRCMACIIAHAYRLRDGQVVSFEQNKTVLKSELIQEVLLDWDD